MGQESRGDLRVAVNSRVLQDNVIRRRCDPPIQVLSERRPTLAGHEVVLHTVPPVRIVYRMGSPGSPAPQCWVEVPDDVHVEVKLDPEGAARG